MGRDSALRQGMNYEDAIAMGNKAVFGTQAGSNVLEASGLMKNPILRGTIGFAKTEEFKAMDTFTKLLGETR
jgi:hypothetical protein